MPGQVEQLEPVPTIQAERFAGYQHYQDPTRLPFNVLTYPSINCFIPNRDKIVPRKGKTLLGQPYTITVPGIDFDSFSQGVALQQSIAFDALSSGASGTNSLSVSHTCSGANRILWVSVYTANSTGGDQVTGVTYNGVPMTLALKLAHSANNEEYLFYLIAPATGAHNIVVSATAIDSFLRLIAGSYTGARQASVPNVTAFTGPASSAAIAITGITTVDNCWLVGAIRTSIVDTITGGAGTTLRSQLLVSALIDSGGPVTPAGSHTLNANITPADTVSGIMAAFEPAIQATVTVPHTCLGDNRILWVSIYTSNSTGGDQVTAVTYNGVPMTLAAKVALDANHERYLYYLVAPDVGTNDIVVTATAISDVLGLAASSFTGAKQVAPTVFNTAGPNAAVSSISISGTTLDDRSWLVGFFTGASAYVGGLAPGADTYFRGGNTNLQMADSGAPITPAGAASLAATFNTPTDAIALLAVFSPIVEDPISQNWPIIGHKKRYTNAGGFDLEVRVVRTGQNPGLKDQIEVLYPNPITGILEWYAFTERVNPLPPGTADRYYFDEFLDTNLNPALSRKNSRLVWVNGTSNIFSWSGGIAPIISVVPNVSITTDAPSWISLGFIDPALGGSDKIVVNGVSYTVSGGWSTDTLMISNTSGINVNDVALAHVSTASGSLDVIPTPVGLAADFCRQNKNYMFYGSFNSKQLYMSNNFNRDPEETITRAQADLDDLIVSTISAYNGLGQAVYRITIDAAGTPDTFQWQKNGGGGSSGVAITGGDQILADNVVIKFLDTTGHTVGDFWEVTATQAIGIIGSSTNRAAWGNFYYGLPRRPGEGYIYNLPANFWTMEPQEGDMYVNDRYGQWGFVNTQIGADLQTETVSFNSLKQVSASKVIYPYMISHLDNALIYVTENKNLDMIERQQLVELPQIGYLSQPVALDFEAATFLEGSMEYLNKRLYITSPRESIMLVYDNQSGNQYWQPPQVITENGILSIVGNTLISHSNLRDQTFNLFTGKSDNGAQFTVRARTSFTSFFKMVARRRIPANWDSKYSSNSFIEGYVTGNPELVFTVFPGVNNPNGKSHIVKPVISNVPADSASIGESVLAAHPLGNDPVFVGDYFNEIYRNFKPVLEYYFVALQIACVSKNHTYEILSIGLNMSFAPTGNNTLIGDREVS